MAQSLLARFCLALAARRYARLLGPRLAHDYGGGGEYTAAKLVLGHEGRVAELDVSTR
ncbi:MAG TPA: hypothetical protein VKW08_05035 [Xanthobacteraceae bacterium]|nr:hypothetical protein [Xanthobacteraceae bacterium]